MQWIVDGGVWKEVSGAGQLLTPGDFFEGGYFMGRITQGGTAYALIVAPKTGGEANLPWSPATLATGVTDPVDGPGNTAALVAIGGKPAASFCHDLSLNGFTDWYLPATNELLEIMRFGSFLPTVDAFVNYYWTSTEDTTQNRAQRVIAGGGVAGGDPKGNYNRVRAVRRVAF
ncbi:DUF1566 domain-containing protein [Pseudorhizobium flavum]|uniref:Lcl domain-containing protein n=1 Tax=Pseudorhizobium flavum TaxID=1335061 RepID=UPI0024909799|nr:DUF1566 domain-containing protein [Pseudorhizobium flavum]